MDKLITLWTGSGIYNLTPGQAFMMAICLLLLYLAIKKGLNPLLLPIGFGGLLANIPEAGLAMSDVENLIHLGTPQQCCTIWLVC